MNLEVRDLKLVRALTQEGSVTRAAQSLHLTQSALSHQLRDLEERTGLQLFTRSRRGLAATDSGLAFLRYARDLLSRMQVAERELAMRSGEQKAVIRMATECYTCYHWLSQVLRPFHAKHPLVEVTVEANATSHPLQALSDGTIDLAFVSSSVRSSRLVVQPIFEDELVAVVPPDHYLASRSFVRAEDLAREVLIVYARPTKNMHIFQKLFLPRQIEPRKVLHVQLTEAIIEMVKAGVGIGVLTRWSVDAAIQSGRLIALSLEKSGLRRVWSAAYRRQRNVPAYITDFIEAVRQSPFLPPTPRQTSPTRKSATTVPTKFKGLDPPSSSSHSRPAPSRGASS